VVDVSGPCYFRLQTVRGSYVDEGWLATLTGAVTGQNWNSTNTVMKYANTNEALFLSAPLSSAVTISGTITPNLWVKESNAAANGALRFEVFWWSPTGGLQSIGVSTDGGMTECGTSYAVRTTPTLTPTSTSFAVGDRVGAAFYIDDGNGVTMASGYNVYLDWGGATAGLDGDSYLTFTEALSFSADSNNARAFGQ